jgi:hypothetical protein
MQNRILKMVAASAASSAIALPVTVHKQLLDLQHPQK